MKTNAKDFIIEHINTGDYSPGYKLKSERELAEDFNIPRSQIHKILQELVAEGYLDCKRGSGYTVYANFARNKKTTRIACLFQFGTANIHRTDSAIGILAIKAAMRNMTITPICYEGQDSSKFTEALTQIIEREEYDALLVQPVWNVDYTEGLSLALANHIPIVCRDFCQIAPALPTVSPNHYALGFMAAKILSAKGYQRPLYIGYSPDSRLHSGMQKYAGFVNGASKYSLRCDDEIFIRDPEEFSCLQRRIKEKMAEEKIDSIFASTWTFAYHTVQVLHECDINPSNSKPGFLSSEFFTSDFPAYKRIDSLVTNNELYAEKTLDMLEDCIKNRFMSVTSSLVINPQYSPGDTLPQKTLYINCTQKAGVF